MQNSTNLFDKSTVERLPALEDLERAEFVKKIWPATILNRTVFEDFSYTAVLEHLVNELNQVRYHRGLFAAQTFEQLFAIIEYLKENGTMKYAEVAEQVQTWYPSEASQDSVRRSIELAVRIWLTVNVHSSSIFVGPISAGDVPNEWPLDYSLERLLQSIFGRRIQIQPRKQPRCDPAVTIAYLVNTCGMKVYWTEDMASHLQFDIRNLELTVYRHKACLISHIDGPDKCPISSDVLEEILDTMDLLLPPPDNATKQLLRKEGQQSLYTLGCRKPTRELDLSRYKYFGEQLEYLIESFSETPRTWKQLALDRRNKSEWSVFWVTVLIGILTLVTIPCNIIQATYSIKAYNVAVAQAQTSNPGRP